MKPFSYSLNFFNYHNLPVILQNEMAECGLACIAMIAGFYGYQSDLNSLRRNFSISLCGTRLHDLIKIAEKLKFSSRPVKLELAQLESLDMPCILHWDMSHFVVLKAVKANKVYIHDPARGEVILSLEETGKHFTGVALELFPEANFEKKKEEKKLSIIDLFQNIKGIRSIIIQILVLSFVLQFFVMASPFYLQIALDEVAVSFDLSLLKMVAFGFSLLLFMQLAVNLLRGKVILYFSSHLNLHMGMQVFQHLVRLPLDYYYKRHLGDIVSRFKAKDEIRQFLSQSLVIGLVDGLMASFIGLMMFFYAPLLAIFVCAAVLLYSSFRFILFPYFSRKTEERVMLVAQADSRFMETIRGMQCVRIFGKEMDRQIVWGKKFVEVINADISLGKLRIKYDFFNQLVLGLENIIVIYLGAKLVVANEMTLGMLIAFTAYKMQFSTRAMSFVEQCLQLKALSVQINRLADMLLTETEKTEGLEYRQAEFSKENITAELSLENISYKHDGSDQYLFKNISMTVAPGEMIAITGGSGAGKSTLLKIMLGLIKPTEGKVLIGGIDIHTIGLSEYRKLIGAVMQDDQLLSGSIGENIAFFNSEMDWEQVRMSAGLSVINFDVEAMPMAYNTLVGDMGTSLSGGQKQRILLARALYREPKVLFLDEATSHLDVRLEGAVNANLKRLNLTCLMIAHRPDTIKFADRIIMLQQGTLVEIKKAPLHAVG